MHERNPPFFGTFQREKTRNHDTKGEEDQDNSETVMGF